MSKRKRIRNAVLRRIASESDEWRVRLLAGSGFSYKLISTRVFGTDSHVALVGRILRRAKLRVRDYREGLNEESNRVLHKITRSNKW